MNMDFNIFSIIFPISSCFCYTVINYCKSNKTEFEMQMLINMVYTKQI